MHGLVALAVAPAVAPAVAVVLAFSPLFRL